MSTQMLVRARDPITSVMAAERVPYFAGSHCDRIHAALVDLKTATASELSAITGLTVVQIDRRMPDLQRARRAEVVQFEGADLIRNGYRVWRAL